MKKTLIIITLLFPFMLLAQSNREVIKSIQAHMLKNYIFLDKAKETNDHLDKLMANNHFDEFNDPIDFAKELGKQMRKITNDKHLNVVVPRPPRNPQSNVPSSFKDMHLPRLNQFRSGGFKEINVFEGNVGYVELNGFRREDIPQVDDVMGYLSTADAIIIDLRNNGGGSELGLYWSSYFLETDIILTSIYERRTDIKTDFITVEVKGKKRPDVPVFILTSNSTFSAAEAFAYDLQSRKRATVIGETTGGGAHPIDFMRLPNGFGLIVPYAESIDPITNTNWEGVGVIPDLEVASDQALTKAKELAKLAAKKYQVRPFQKLETIFKKEALTKEDEEMVSELIQKILHRGHLEDFMVNGYGYSYLESNVNAAKMIFKVNINLFPYSPNAHDSYAEVLAMAGENELALQQYKMAISLATDQNDPGLESFQHNLAAFQTRKP